MKLTKLITIGVLILLISSCDSDESVIEKTGEKELIKVEQKYYTEGILSESYTYIIENKTLKESFSYDKDGLLTYNYKWFYDNSGKTTSVKGFSADKTLIQDASFIYDELGRITKNVNKQDNLTLTVTREFTYNQDNTITSLSNYESDDESGSLPFKTFFINNHGLIYKETSRDSDTRKDLIVEAVYDDHKNVISKTENSEIINYIYDDKLTSDFLLNSSSDYSDTGLNNSVLSINSLRYGGEGFGNKLLIRTEINSEEINGYAYVLDSENYLLTAKYYYKKELVSEAEYIYRE